MTRRADIEAALKHLAPQVPDFEAGAIVDHALDSPGLHSATPENAAWLAMTAFIRHRMTAYDDLLADDYDPDSARFFVADEMQEILESWGARRRL
jgi:hypothetical protein